MKHNYYSFLVLILFAQTTCDQPQNKLARPTTFWHQFGFAPTLPESQREGWSTGLVAEPIATVTNIPFFYVAYKYRNKAPIAAAALTAAGIASAVSHAIPYNILNAVDKFFAATSVLAVAYETEMYKPENIKKTLKNKSTMGLLALTGITYIADIFLPRSGLERKDEYKYIHGLWHLLAAALADTALELKNADKKNNIDDEQK